MWHVTITTHRLKSTTIRYTFLKCGRGPSRDEDDHPELSRFGIVWRVTKILILNWEWCTTGEYNRSNLHQEAFVSREGPGDDGRSIHWQLNNIIYLSHAKKMGTEFLWVLCWQRFPLFIAGWLQTGWPSCCGCGRVNSGFKIIIVHTCTPHHHDLSQWCSSIQHEVLDRDLKRQRVLDRDLKRPHVTWNTSQNRVDVNDMKLRKRHLELVIARVMRAQAAAAA